MAKILFIEDDAMLVEMYEHKFWQAGFEVEVALNGKEGMAKISSMTPDIIILDLLMPKKGGFDFLKEAGPKLRESGVPIVILTNVQVDVEDMLKNWQAATVMLKSKVTPEQVVEKVREVLGNPAAKQ